MAKEVEPGFDGYSIGKWIDEDGDGKFDVLEAETRYFSGPRAFDSAAFLCMRTMRPSSRSAILSTRRTRIFCTTRSLSPTMP
jgi:hypothetical protein